MVKKLLAVSLSVAMTLAMAVSAFAAGTVNSEEQRVLDAIKADKVDDSSAQKYFTQATKFFERDDIDATKAQADEVIGYVNQAAAVAKSAGLKSEKDILNASDDVKNQLIEYAKKAAAVFGLTVRVDSKSGVIEFIKTDATTGTTQVGATTNTSTKTTGANEMAGVAVVSVLGLAVAALAVVTKKNAEA